MTQTPSAIPYRRLLLVVDLGTDSLAVGRRARAIAAATGATIDLLHVVEYVPSESVNEVLLPALEIEGELVRGARERLAQLARELGLPVDRTRVEAGNTEAEILRVAAETGSDVIVIGAHERHGLSILVNLTADRLLHAAPCDVLAVRLR